MLRDKYTQAVIDNLHVHVIQRDQLRAPKSPAEAEREQKTIAKSVMAGVARNKNPSQSDGGRRRRLSGRSPDSPTRADKDRAHELARMTTTRQEANATLELDQDRRGRCTIRVFGSTVAGEVASLGGGWCERRRLLAHILPAISTRTSTGP